MAYEWAPQWRAIAIEAVNKGTQVKWGDLPEGVGGNYDPNTRTITISSTLKNASTDELAAILGHEADHVIQGPAATPANCVANEMEAFSWEAYVWASVPHRSVASGFAPELNQILDAWRNKGLRDFVLRQPLYHKECLAGALPTY